MKPAESQNDFTLGSMAGNIVKLAVPMSLAQLINVLYNVVDRMYIGRIPDVGTLSLTGLGVSFPILMMISAFTNLFGTGGAPLSSIARGEGRNEEAQTIMANSFTLLLISGVVLTIVGFLVKKPLLYAFGASDVTYPYADDYLSVYLWGTIFVMLGLGMNAFINAQGFGKMGMLSVAIGAVINIVLDPIFIFAMNMGVKGAALATIISQAVSCFVVLAFLSGPHTLLRLTQKSLRLDWPIVKRISALGLSGFTMSLTNSAVQIACNRSLLAYGGDIYVGVMTVINSIREIIIMVVHGLTQSAQPVLGYNYGAKRYDRVREGIRFTAAAGIVYSTVVWILLMLFPTFFIRIFSKDEALLAPAVEALRCYYLAYFLMSLQFSGQCVFVGLGKAKQAIFFSLFRKVVLVVPLVLLLPMVGGLGVKGVFLSEPISDLVGGGACFLTMYFTLYRKLGKEVSAENPSENN